MIPPHVHINWQLFVKAGNWPIFTVGEPGVQGLAVAGIQGAGVKAPSLAAVAAITAGFDGALHRPKGIMLTMGA
jgi:hypothetical protein